MSQPEKSPSCSDILELLSDYFDLELPPDACRQIEQHLSGCQPCDEFAASLRDTVELCRRYQPSELPQPINAAARAQLLDAYQKMLRARKTTE
jgi:anti-sigma factor RsiW